MFLLLTHGYSLEFCCGFREILACRSELKIKLKVFSANRSYVGASHVTCALYLTFSSGTGERPLSPELS